MPILVQKWSISDSLNAYACIRKIHFRNSVGDYQPENYSLSNMCNFNCFTQHIISNSPCNADKYNKYAIMSG